MKCSLSIVLLVASIVACYAKSDDLTITSEIYSLDGDFDKIRASAHIEFELTHVTSEPTVTIETEQWVHTKRYIAVTTRPNERLDIKLTSGITYPAIKVYVKYRTPLVSLEIDEASSVKSRNVISSNSLLSFNVAHSGTGAVTLQLQHESNIVVAMSGTGRLTLLGRVRGNGQLSFSGTGELNAFYCSMQIVNIQMSGTGFAYVYGVEGIHAAVSGTGTLCYRGPLLSYVMSGSGSIRECVPEETTDEPGQTTKEPEHSSSRSNQIMSRSQRLIMIFAPMIFFRFFQLIINQHACFSFSIL